MRRNVKISFADGPRPNRTQQKVPLQGALPGTGPRGTGQISSRLMGEQNHSLLPSLSRKLPT